MSIRFIEWGRRIDCAKNGCPEPHADNGEVVPFAGEARYGAAAPSPRPGPSGAPGFWVNGHACTLVRSVAGPWESDEEST